jgi:thiol:disulfide interchange protein DsbD
MKRWIAAVGAALTVLGASAAPAEPVRDGREGRVAVELAPETAGVAPGGTFHVALRQQIDKGWHTYWRNAGDSGEPTRIVWTLPAGWSAGEIVWPTPSRQSASETILNYGYDGEVFLPVPIQVPATARPGETVTLKAAAAWLVCKDICIPEDATLEVSVPVVAGTPEPHPEFGRAVARTIAAAPKPAGLTAGYVNEGGALKVAAAGAALAGADFGGAYFYPFDGAAITHAAPQTVERGPQGLTLTIAPGYAFQGGAPPTSLAGVLALEDGTAFEIDAVGGSLPVGAAGLGAPPAQAEGGGGAGIGLPLALGLALLGGLVLNLMPCVFPVLAMKAASLAGHAQDRRGARLRGLAFAAGVVATFLALAGALIAFRAAGEAVGWGFQLQSPAVVAGLALLTLLIALNLSGVFEVGGGVQNLGGGGAGRQDALGAFLTGALAVVVAAPCTAPFMAGALGYALTQPPAVSLLVFAALAVGFAAPFTALSFAPGLLARLPRPGPWMDGFRKLLAFPMYGTALWLTWVFTQQLGTSALAELLALGLLTAFAAWVFGAGQRGGARVRQAGAVLAAGVLALFVVSAWRMSTLGAGADSAPAQVAESAIPSESYSPARLAALRAEGRPVFVNFTADWCVTCKVNERAALASAEVASAFQDAGVVYLKGDWTRRDDVIAAALAEHGRSGVPLYLLYTPGASSPKVLPQLLTEGAVVAALRAASPAS